MSIRNLEFALKPRSIALIGASERADSVGRTLFENLRGGGFAGPVMPVNPNRDRVLGASGVSIDRRICRARPISR